jgi:hypothetical protein
MGPDSPLFVSDERGTPLTKAVFQKEMARLLFLATNDKISYTTHSLRRGGAQYALTAGCDKLCIQMQGDWGSDAFLFYLTITPELKLKTLKIIEDSLIK